MDFLKTGRMIVEATEAAARAVMPFSGKNDRNQADHCAVEAMRTVLNQLPLNLEVVLGEGEKDKAPMLYAGEKLGRMPVQESPLGLVVDPLECTSNFARGLPDSLSVIMANPLGHVHSVPGTYMEQILIPVAAESLDIQLDDPVDVILAATASALNRKVSDITVVVQDRPRHKTLIEKIRTAGAGVALIESGSISAAVEVLLDKRTQWNMIWGSFGAPEGLVLAFMAQSMGCFFQGRVAPHNEKTLMETRELGLENRILDGTEWTGKEGVVALSVIHSNLWLRGIHYQQEGDRQTIVVNSLLWHSRGVEKVTHVDGQRTSLTPFSLK